MEGVGSTRLGRASARYGSSTAVFNGPVRKWKKKWVHVSSSSSTAKHSQSNGNGSSAASSILLCRWTPLSFADSGSSAAFEGEDEEQQPPKRKFRYTPVAVLEEERKRAAAKQVEDGIKTNQSPNWLSSKTDNEPDMNEISKKETQDPNKGNLDIGLCLKGGHDDSRNSVGENVGQDKAASSTGFRAIRGN